MHRFPRTAPSLLLLIACVAYAGDLEDGQALQAAGQFEQALPKYEAAAKADPTDPAAALGLSQVLSGLGRYDQAAKAVDAARKAHPENASLLAAKGRAYFLSMLKAQAAEEPDGSFIEGCHEDALRWAKEAMKADQKNVEALLLLGQIHQKDGNGEQAIQFFQQAANADPKNFDAAFEVGNHWFLQANNDKSNMTMWSNAEQGFLAALRIDPKSARAAANVAHCKAWQKAPGKDVADAYFRAYTLAPTDTTHLDRALQWTPAAERVGVFRKFAEEAPKDVQRKIYLAAALSGAGEHGKAAEVLEEASKLEPQNPLVPLKEGDVALAEGKHLDGAIDFYVEALSLFKAKGAIDDKSYGRLAGTIGFQSKSLSAAQREKLWTALWKFFPERYDAANNAGLWYRDIAKDYKQSLEWYLRAAKVATDDACVQNDTGLMFYWPAYHIDEPEKAVPYLERAVEIGEKNGYDWNAPAPPGVGYRDGINNLAAAHIQMKHWDALKKFVEQHVPESHPMRELWLKQAEEKK